MSEQSDRLEEATRLGAEAASRGFGTHTNPYPPGPLAAAWHDGFSAWKPEQRVPQIPPGALPRGVEDTGEDN